MMLAIVQARTTSSRLPGKVLLPILGQPMIVRQLERIRRARRVDRVLVATSVDPSDDLLADVVQAAGVAVFRGALDDVLDRFHAAAASVGPEHVVRLTGDCPLVDPALVDHIVAEHLAHGADYTSNSLQRSWPDGLDVEVMRMAALAEARRIAELPSEREHVTPRLHRDPFRRHAVVHGEDLAALRWVVDHAADLATVRAVFARLHPVDPAFGFADVLALQRAEPGLFAPSQHFDPDEGWRRSLAADEAFRSRQERP
jgi:spore coat polysaccharide biosynthesis protein SpsF